MKKKVFFAAVFLGAGLCAAAQVKIGNNPTVIGTSSLLELEHPTKAFKLTGVKDTTMITAPKDGMMVYDSANRKIQVRQGGYWTPFAYNAHKHYGTTNATKAIATLLPKAIRRKPLES